MSLVNVLRAYCLTVMAASNSSCLSCLLGAACIQALRMLPWGVPPCLLLHSK